MKRILQFLVFCAAVCIGTSVRNRDDQKYTNHLAYGVLVYGMELILTKFEVVMGKLQKMEDKLLQTENKLQKLENQINEHRSTLQSELFTAFGKLENQVVFNLSELQYRNQEKIDVAIHKLERDLGRVLHNQDRQSTFSSCKAVTSNISDTYLIRLKRNSQAFKVYCEQNAFGGGWIVIQHRYDGSLDFYRGWNEFRDGFGDVEKEFWLGLEIVHKLTKARKHELIVELKDLSGNYAYARYDAFEIGSEDEDYALKDLGAYNGTAGESMSNNKDEKFSTKDRDNDQSSYGQCAHEREGAWWHFQCTFANLNGRYMDADDDKSMYWDDMKERKKMIYSRMMIREVE
ncbi:fibrinogen-like protein A [Anopheles aquasalis]|uniref:fibrinogen-like protein A n=1 Tax=Anopheles aquasalis TaxID=42839 RepID=UPI00215B1E8A|nr:fibrinogen-like protein A [Anopheles aquasalis]